MEVRIELLKRVWHKAKSKAGKRYSALYNVPLALAENLKTPLQTASAMAIFEKLNNELLEKSGRVNWVWIQTKSNKATVTKANRSIDKVSRELIALFEKQADAPAEFDFEAVRKEMKSTLKILKPITKIIEEEEMKDEHGTESQNRRDFQNLLYKFYDLEHSLSDYFLQMLNSPFVYLTGRAGTGKTHILCSIVEERLSKGMPAVVFLGQEYQSIGKDPWDSLIKNIDPSLTGKGFLKGLDKLGRINSTRALICIDAINESDIDGWNKSLPDFCKALSSYKHIALIISFRSEYLDLLSKSLTKCDFREVFHVGFPPEKQLEAIKKYFTEFSIPWPKFPLLETEFSNPLFLRLFCETVQTVDEKKKHIHLKEVASGQSGMTKVLEDFVWEKGKKIETNLGISPQIVWKSIKEGLAPEMARRKKTYLSVRSAKRELKRYQPAGMSGNGLYQALIEEDILSRDIIYRKGKISKVVRFTYNRFSDYIIARHIYKNLGSKESIKSSLKDPNGLGAYFSRRKRSVNLGIQEALLIEFPQRTGNEKELLDYLGWKTYPVDLIKSFIEGLYWRDGKNINRHTIQWVKGALRHPSLRNPALNLIVSLSVKPKNPLGKVLQPYLNSQTLPERDLTWTEYLRKQDEEDIVNRMITWLDLTYDLKYPNEVSKLYLGTLMWFLTSTNIDFRDKVTEKLFLFGKKFPNLIFNLTLESLSCNDPYIWTRMLAASYGVALAVYNDNSDKKKLDVKKFGKKIYQEMFALNAPHITTNALAREYARSIVVISLKLDPSIISQSAQKRIKDPLPENPKFNWHQSFDIDRKKLQPGQSPLHMDFENYTLGRLVYSRPNYNYTDNDYLRVRRQILWRVYDLGYSYKSFETIDKNINQYSWRDERSGKIERYGKKYSWIAYFEMAGYRENRNLLGPYRYRLSESDIDPSFPMQPNTEGVYDKLVLPDMPVSEFIISDYRPEIEKGFVKNILGHKRGPWIMIDGLIDRTRDDKKIFVFIRGFFVKNSDFEKTMKSLKDVSYPGDRNIPEAMDQHETFAGEVPWSTDWIEYDEDSRCLKLNTETIPVIMAVANYRQPGNGSNVNTFSGFPSVSKEVAKALSLESGPSSVDAFDKKGQKVTTLVCKGDVYRNHETLLYLKKEQLEAFLREHNLTLILYSWGERTYNYMDKEVVSPEVREARFENLEEILHKQAHYFSDGKFIQFL